MSPTVYLVTGANRGLGLGLVTSLVQRPDVVVFAGARDPSSSSLTSLASKYPGKLIPLKVVSADEVNNRAALEEIKQKAGRLDVVIANAGIATYYGSVVESPAQELRDHIEVNTVGPLVLFQSAWPLLKSSPSPKFVIVSSTAGSLASTEHVPIANAIYGASKAAINFIALKIHWENPELIIFPVCPGGLDTDMGAHAAKSDPFMAQVPLVSVETSGTGILKHVDEATRESHGGKFVSHTGDPVPW